MEVMESEVQVCENCMKIVRNYSYFPKLARHLEVNKRIRSPKSLQKDHSTTRRTVSLL